MEVASDHSSSDGQTRLGRDVRIDGLRGLFLALMTFNHLPNSLYPLTYQPLGFATAAEGFVLLSGWVAGLVYARTAQRRGFGVLRGRVIRRAGLIYACHFGGFTAIWACVVFAGVESDVWKGWAPLFYQQPGWAIGLGSVFIYQPSFFQILPMYFFFTLALPLLLRSLFGGRWSWVLWLSVGLWFAAQFGLQQRLNFFLQRYIPAHLGLFDLMAWQLLFVFGVLAGWSRHAGKRLFFQNNRPVLILCVACVLFCFLLRREMILSDGVASILVKASTQKPTLGPLRTLNVFALFVVIASLRIPNRDYAVVRVFALLGRHSLCVFTYHIFAVHLFSWAFVPPGEEPARIGVGLAALCVLTLFAPAWISERWRLRRKSDDRG